MNKQNRQEAEQAWAIVRQGINMNWLDRQLGLARNTVASWKIVPQKHVNKITFLLGIPPYRLRPDIDFSDPPSDPWSDI